MGKQEFIDRLRTALNGNVPQALVMENVNYYSDYIDAQIRSGRPEGEVMASLGDPRLIAKTIIETSAGEEGAEDASYRDAGSGYGGYGQGYYQAGNGQGYGQGYGDAGKKAVRVPGWVWLIAVILIIVLVFSAVFSVLSFLAPILIPLLVVVFLVKLFRDWLN